VQVINERLFHAGPTPLPIRCGISWASPRSTIDGRVPEGPRPDHRGSHAGLPHQAARDHPDRKRHSGHGRRWSRTSSARGDAGRAQCGEVRERWVSIAKAYGWRVWSWPSVGGRLRPRRDGGVPGRGRPRGGHPLRDPLRDLDGGAPRPGGNAGACRERGKLVLADVITTLGIHPVEFDAWGLLGAVAGSQKGLMLPPGLAFVALSETGWERTKQAGLSRFYLDLGRARASLNKNSTPFTPGIRSCSRWRRRSGSWRGRAGRRLCAPRASRRGVPGRGAGHGAGSLRGDPRRPIACPCISRSTRTPPAVLLGARTAVTPLAGVSAKRSSSMARTTARHASA